MGLQSCKIDEKAKTITLVMDLDTPRASGSGKTMVVASTSGNKDSGAAYKGKPIIVGVNAYFKP